MLRSICKAALSLAALAPVVDAQFPSEPVGITVLRSQFDEDVTITYKENDVCETTPGVRSFAGHVHLPPNTLSLDEPQDYPINTFFWFFEARTDPTNAPLAIWLNGGPGASSMSGLFVENGPCYVNADSNSTRLSEWAWNNEVNTLFLDQPVQVGFSYNTLVNVTRDLLSSNITYLNETETVPEQNATLLVGTAPSREPDETAEGSRNAAIALWHFAQVWFQEFPEYEPGDDRVSIATQSYGGRYGPAFAAFFEEQNQRIENGTWEGMEGTQFYINLDTLMIVNGCLDRQVQWPSYPETAFRNTYGIETVNETIYNEMVDGYYREGGCRDRIENCRAVVAESDPGNRAINDTVNEICQDAETYCTEQVRDPYLQYSGRDYYDITALDPHAFPEPFYQGFLNQPWVQESMGMPLNWTGSSSVVSSAFRGMGDYPRPGWLEDLAFLLESGIKVALVYGEADFACNALGGEAVSLAINYTGTENFAAAGYAPIQANDSYIGGAVRQYGNLSYSMVYDAGHAIPSYQPETSYRIFMRALFNRDISTGTVSTAGNYSSQGNVNPWARHEIPEQRTGFCYTLDPSTCTEEQIESILDGTAVIESWILVNENSTMLFPEVVGGGMAPNGTVPMPMPGNETGNGTVPGVQPKPSDTVPYEGGAVGVARPASGLLMVVVALGALML
ncbi:hypothetical protein MBLNU230_g0482t2 [Neophaeotheca triangularis]